MQIYDRILANKATNSLVWLILGTSTAILFEAVLRFSRGHISSWIAAKKEYKMGQYLFESLMSSKLEYFLKDGPTTHYDRLNCVGKIASFYSGQVFQIILDLPFVFIFLYVIYYLGPPLFYFMSTIIVLYLAISFIFRSKFLKFKKLESEESNKKQHFIIEKLSRIHSIKSLSLEDQILRQFETHQERQSSIESKVNFWNNLSVNIAAVFSQIALFGTIGFGAKYVINGSLTIGTLTACMIFGQRCMQQVQRVVTFFNAHSETI